MNQTSHKLFYGFIDTPVGNLLIVGNDTTIYQLSFELEKFDNALNRLSIALKTEPVENQSRVEPILEELEQYFAGNRKEFSIQPNLALSNGFYSQAQKALAEIPYGETRSYKELAISLDNPNAFRAAASACANNPIPIILPCHRVIKSDGSLGGYLGNSVAGLAIKSKLLELEKAPRSMS